MKLLLEIPNCPQYYADTDGNIYRRWGEKLKKLKPWMRRGHSSVHVFIKGKRDKKYVHRLVLETFLGPANGRLVRHLNDIASDNSLSNLIYGTHLENRRDLWTNYQKYKSHYILTKPTI